MNIPLNHEIETRFRTFLWQLLYNIKWIV